MRSCMQIHANEELPWKAGPKTTKRVLRCGLLLLHVLGPHVPGSRQKLTELHSAVDATNSVTALRNFRPTTVAVVNEFIESQEQEKILSSKDNRKSHEYLGDVHAHLAYLLKCIHTPFRLFLDIGDMDLVSSQLLFADV